MKYLTKSPIIVLSKMKGVGLNYFEGDAKMRVAYVNSLFTHVSEYVFQIL